MTYLSKEDLEYIKKYITTSGMKDSDFEQVTTLNGTESFALIKGNKNYRIPATLLRTLFNNDGLTTLGGIQIVDSYDELSTIKAKSYGNLVYVKDEDRYYSWSSSDEWNAIVKVYIGKDEPKDKTVIWIDTEDKATDIDADSDENTEIANLKSAVTALQTNQNKLLKLLEYGVIGGNASTSARQVMMASANAVEPKLDDDGNLVSSEETATSDSDDVNKPDSSDYDATVPAIVLKMDEASNFGKNRANLTDGELLWYTDKKKLAVFYKGGFFGVSGSSSSDSGSGGGISVDDLYNTSLDYLVFKHNNKNYKIEVHDNGEISCREYSTDNTVSGSKDGTWGVYISQYLNLNTIFCGGEISEDNACSHNFVELANGSDNDINLNGILLLYTDGSILGAGPGRRWKVLPLEGIIPAHGTFLIRGARCNSDKASFIRVNKYDMEWEDDGQPIVFSQTTGTASFYLAVGSKSDKWVYDESGNLLGLASLNNPWSKNTTYQGYIDSCGFGSGAVAEGNAPLVFDTGDSFSKAMFVRWFMFEPAKQGNKAYGKRKTSDLWTYINLERQQQKLGNSIQYYYPDYMKQRYSPKPSTAGKDFFTNKNIFNPNKPNIINITFGIQATVSSTKKASRCFNWVSVGYYDEFLQYRKKGDTAWNTVYSITDNDVSNPSRITKFIEHYRRFRWCTSNGTWVTTHKVILHELLDAGTYEYRIGRDNDESYYSHIMEFTVINSPTEFSFIQDTDQQGFNWAEYTAWKKSAYMISKEKNVNFFINTGDIAQSGNRESEWLDYYDGRQYLRDREEMFTIGNNDLCGHDATQLTDGNDATSKYNHINILRYYTFELDENNDYSFTWNGVSYPLYSLYSFNYGNYHFVSINSEIAQASSKTYVDYDSNTYAGDKTYAEAANAAIEDWFKKDLQIYYGIGDAEPSACKNTIVYMHEMPFTIATWNFLHSSSNARVGSHLNTLNSRGLYRYSRIFKKYGIRLVIGGHKHTYAISKPIYDAPEGYITNTNTVNSSVDLMGEVTNEMSRVPVIQVTKAADIDSSMANFARYEVVSAIDAPTYVMSQATGYKLVSNKEQPSGDAYTCPWLLSYFKAKTSAASPTENVEQHYPMYIRYDLDGSSIKITAKQIHGVWTVNVAKNTKVFDMNNQESTLSVEAMTLSKTTAADKSAYNIDSSEVETYTINL